MGFNPIALRTAKTLWSFGLSECSRVNRINTVNKRPEKSQLNKKMWKTNIVGQMLISFDVEAAMCF